MRLRLNYLKKLRSTRTLQRVCLAPSIQFLSVPAWLPYLFSLPHSASHHNPPTLMSAPPPSGLLQAQHCMVFFCSSAATPPPRGVWHCIQIPLLWANLALRASGPKPLSLMPPTALLSTPPAWPTRPILLPLPPHLSNSPLHSLSLAMLPHPQPRLTDSRAPCPWVPVPHPAITAPRRYSSNRQKVPRFCGAMVSRCRPLCRSLAHTLLTASAAAASAHQPTRR